MFRQILAVLALIYAAAAFAAVDINQANAADLDGIKGIGPGISSKILDERKKGNFKDWNDFIARVPGIGEANAAKFSAQGMTVGGAAFKAAKSKASAATSKKAMAEEKRMKDEDAARKRADKKALDGAQVGRSNTATAAKPPASAAK